MLWMASWCVISTCRHSLSHFLAMKEMKMWRWQQHSWPSCSLLWGLIFPHSRVTGGEGLCFPHPWVSTFIVCHTTLPSASSQGPFKDIILYKTHSCWVMVMLPDCDSPSAWEVPEAALIGGRGANLGWHLLVPSDQATLWEHNSQRW